MPFPPRLPALAAALAAALSLCLASLASAQTPAPPPAPAPSPPDLSKLTSEHRAALKCSAAFAIVASEQQRGLDSALAWPPLAFRGKEYFVRSSARVMDEAGLTQEQVRDLLVADVAALQQQATRTGDPDGTVNAVMKPCLSLLDAEVPPLERPSLVQCSAILAIAYEAVHSREGMSPTAKDLDTLSTVLADRARKQLLAEGKSGNDADRALGEARDAMLNDAANGASTGGADKYDIAACYDLAKPDPKTHY